MRKGPYLLAIMITCAAVFGTGCARVDTSQLTPSPPLMLSPQLMPSMGFADLHNHQFAYLGFGGRAFVGSAFGEISDALESCTLVHGPLGALDLLGNIVSFVYETGLGHWTDGYPHFTGWPHWKSLTHQAVYEDWLKRALDGGLRLMVMLAVNNEEACQAVIRAEGRTCNDMEAVDLQLAEAKKMAAYIDSKNGGDGWYKIVDSPQQARAVINAGKLAVVLGIEVDHLFNCRTLRDCTEQDVRQALEKYYNKGVRHVFPIHFNDNAFGGTAIFIPLSKPDSTRDCAADGYTYRRFGPLSSVDCNTLGLTNLGEFLVKEMMSKHMIVEVGHMSALAVNRTLDIAEALKYPGVVSGHTGFFDVSLRQAGHEGNLTGAQVERIRHLGGMVGVLARLGNLHEISTWRGLGATAVAHQCGNTTETWAQAYLYAIEKMGNTPVAFGSDFNGFNGLPGPRFGREQCPGGGPYGTSPRQELHYPFKARAAADRPMSKSLIGTRTFDINMDGLAHVGMLPDFIADLETLGLTERDLEPLLKSAEGYIRMWERALAVGVPSP
jgi:microsomal dipeptidase-like Zn-dependent dipeptidase